MKLLWSKDIHSTNSGNVKFPLAVLRSLLKLGGQNVINHIVKELEAFGAFEPTVFRDNVTMRKNRSGSLQKCGTYGKRSIIYDPVCDLWQITKNKFWFKSDHTNTFRILKFVFRFDKKKSEKKAEGIHSPVIEIFSRSIKGVNPTNRLIRLYKADENDKNTHEWLGKDSHTMTFVKMLFTNRHIAHSLMNHGNDELKAKLHTKYVELKNILFGVDLNNGTKPVCNYKRACALNMFLPGDYVRIESNAANMSAINGQKGYIREYLSASQQYVVTLESGEAYKFHPMVIVWQGHSPDSIADMEDSM